MGALGVFIYSLYIYVPYSVGSRSELQMEFSTIWRAGESPLTFPRFFPLSSMSLSADERNVPRDRNVGMLPGAFHRGGALMLFSAERPF